MDVEQLRRIAATAPVRHARYQAMVAGFYEMVSDAFTDEWGDSQHCGLFSEGAPTREAAVAALETFLVRVAGLRAGMRVLDLGAGLGGPARHIARRSGAHVTGVDLTAGRVRIAAERTRAAEMDGQVRFLAADALMLPFPDGAFDAVYTFEMGAHVPDKAALYAECARVLRPGGIFAGTDWFAADRLSAEATERYIEPICRLISIPNLISLAELRALLAGGGFRVRAAADLADEGDVIPNFTLVSERAAADLERAELSPLDRLLAEGGLALRDAFEADTFLMGYWIAVSGQPSAISGGAAAEAANGPADAADR